MKSCHCADKGSTPYDRHNWNCELTPIYAQLYWETDDLVMLRSGR